MESPNKDELNDDGPAASGAKPECLLTFLMLTGIGTALAVMGMWAVTVGSSGLIVLLGAPATSVCTQGIPLENPITTFFASVYMLACGFALTLAFGIPTVLHIRARWNSYRSNLSIAQGD